MADDAAGTAGDADRTLGELVFGPVRVIQNVLDRSKEIMNEHREWLSDFPNVGFHNVESPPSCPTSTHPPMALITPAPIISRQETTEGPKNHKRQQPTDCNSQINQIKSQLSADFSQRLADQSKQAAIQLSQATSASSTAKAAADSAKAALASIQTSASMALSSATMSVSSANSLASVASASASSAILSASSSASSVIAIAQGSAMSAISSASRSVEDAKATATFAIQQAQATVSSVNDQAAAQVKASQTQAITATQTAVAIVVSIVGSSLLSILVYFLLARYRRRRAVKGPIQRESVAAYDNDGDRKVNIGRRGSTPSISAFPRPPSRQPRNTYMQPDSEFDPSSPMGFQRDGPFSISSAKQVQVGGRQEVQVVEIEPRKSMSARKTVLIYDSEYPEKPPKLFVEDDDTDMESGQITKKNADHSNSIKDKGNRGAVWGKKESIGAAL